MIHQRGGPKYDLKKWDLCKKSLVLLLPTSSPRTSIEYLGVSTIDNQHSVRNWRQLYIITSWCFCPFCEGKRSCPYHANMVFSCKWHTIMNYWRLFLYMYWQVLFMWSAYNQFLLIKKITYMCVKINVSPPHTFDQRFQIIYMTASPSNILNSRSLPKLDTDKAAL